MIYDEREAYAYLAETVMDFVKGRKFDRAMCRCDIYKTMVSSSCWLLYNNEIEKKSLDWPNTDIPTSEAAIFLKNATLKQTGFRIWGLVFTLYPDGKFEIEYDYNKPDDYEESDDIISGDEINQSLDKLGIR